MRGRMASNWRIRKGSHAATSSGAGLRFPGGRHLRCCRCRRRRASNPWPRHFRQKLSGPAPRSPWRSSSAPGLIKTSSAWDSLPENEPAFCPERTSLTVAQGLMTASRSRRRRGTGTVLSGGVFRKPAQDGGLTAPERRRQPGRKTALRAWSSRSRAQMMNSSGTPLKRSPPPRARRSHRSRSDRPPRACPSRKRLHPLSDSGCG